MANSKQEPLPGMTGKGVAPLSIPKIDKAAAKYERKKEERCKASPGEIAAKGELQEALHEHRERLPKDKDGNPFYRYEDRIYILEEKLKQRKADEEDAKIEGFPAMTEPPSRN